MKTAIWKQTLAIAAVSFAANTAYAGNFTTVVNTGARTGGSTSSTATDPFYLTSISASWTQLATNTATVYSPINGSAVGSYIDTVWYESSSNSYILGSYFQLSNTSNGITEINSIVRSGLSDVTTMSAAWTSAANVYSGAATGYRLRDPSRSDYIASYNAANAASYLDLDKLAIRTDVSPSEGNPNSGLYLIKFSADNMTYQLTENAIRIVQGASATEGGRQFAEMFVSGYTVTMVPEADTYAMMMAGLGLMGFIARRRKSA